MAKLELWFIDQPYLVLTKSAFHDDQHDVNNVDYATTSINGNGDTMLEAGELVELDLSFTSGNMAGITVGANATFTIESKPAQGSYMVIQRTTPPSIGRSIINLN